MKARQLVGTVVDTVIKIVVIVVAVMLIYKYALQAYDFGYKLFAEPPMTTAEDAKVISISISEEATVMDIAKVLEENGLISDARLFYVQEFLSGHHDEMIPGIYELSSDMTAEQMIEIITTETVAEEGEADGEAEGASDAESAETAEDAERAEGTGEE